MTSTTGKKDTQGGTIRRQKVFHSPKIPLKHYFVFYRVFTNCVTFDTPLFSDIYSRSRLSFYVVIRHTGGLDFLKKNLEFFYFVRFRARYKLSLVYRLSTVCSKFKFMLSAVI